MKTEQLAIVVTGAVGVLAPGLSAFFGWLREKQQAKRERVAKDFADLRAVLDELLPVMFDHTNHLLALERWMQASAFGLPHADAAPVGTDTRRRLYASNARLVIRRGRNDVLVKSLGRYLKAVDEALAEIDRLWPDEPFAYKDEQLDERAQRYWQAYENFADTCKAEVGTVTR